MNSYNENLNSVVVTSLQSQNLDEKSIYSKLNASMFTLYYAEGATISAEEKLIEDSEELKNKRITMLQAVKNTNLSNNLLASATQANQYYKQSINNMAVCAANVQVAANAIVKLASDVGSIFSIVNAADRKSDIFADADRVRALVDNTAHSAELASKLAMETSMYTSEVSVPTLLDRSKSANLAINNLLTITSTDFDNISTIVKENNTALAAASAKEKLAEGVLEDIAIDYRATKGAYNSTNKELNLDLWITYLYQTVYTISFNALENPFYKAETVDNYHLIVVKDEKKATFSMSNAESIRINEDPTQYISVEDLNFGKLELSLDFLNFIQNSNGTTSPCKDSDGEILKLGEKYVVFVMAVYKDDFKREINNFDDFLSAPSQEFILTEKILAVDSDTIKMHPVSDVKSPDEINVELDFKFSQNQSLTIDFEFPEESLTNAEYTYRMSFYTPIYKGSNLLEHRCIFLPDTYKLQSKLLTARNLRILVADAARTARDSEHASLHTQIKRLKKELKTLTTKETDLNNALKKIVTQLSKPISDPVSKQLMVDEKEIQKQLAHVSVGKAQISNSLKFAEEELKNLDDKTKNENQELNFDFFFNLALAEQVTAGNYYGAIPDPTTSEVAGRQSWVAYVGPETTDNFGNFLIPGNKYTPIILSTSPDAIDSPSSYKNALSGINPHSEFTFPKS
jgi:hypothetical protein